MFHFNFLSPLHQIYFVLEFIYFKLSAVYTSITSVVRANFLLYRVKLGAYMSVFFHDGIEPSRWSDHRIIDFTMYWRIRVSIMTSKVIWINWAVWLEIKSTELPWDPLWSCSILSHWWTSSHISEHLKVESWWTSHSSWGSRHLKSFNGTKLL